MYKRPFFWIAIAITALFALVPGIGGDVSLRESLLLGAVYIVLASNLNLMIGYTGYVNFGNIAFFGLGGYLGMYMVTALHWPLWLASLLAGACVSLLALLLGLGILRLRGAYFALATIGIVEAVKALVANLPAFGGAILFKSAFFVTALNPKTIAFFCRISATVYQQPE